MWIFTTIGFFSATLTNPTYKELPKRQQKNHIMVRARVREDLVRLVDLHENVVCEKRPKILELATHDYPYRIVIPISAWVTLVSHLAGAIHYSNFKSAVETASSDKFEGRARHDLYMRVWGIMNQAEAWLRNRNKAFSKWEGPKYTLDLFPVKKKK